MENSLLFKIRFKYFLAQVDRPMFHLFRNSHLKTFLSFLLQGSLALYPPKFRRIPAHNSTTSNSQHKFHSTCLAETVMPHLAAPRQRKLGELQHQLANFTKVVQNHYIYRMPIILFLCHISCSIDESQKSKFESRKRNLKF